MSEMLDAFLGVGVGVWPPSLRVYFWTAGGACDSAMLSHTKITQAMTSYHTHARSHTNVCSPSLSRRCYTEGCSKRALNSDPKNHFRHAAIFALFYVCLWVVRTVEQVGDDIIY